MRFTGANLELVKFGLECARLRELTALITAEDVRLDPEAYSFHNRQITALRELSRKVNLAIIKESK